MAPHKNNPTTPKRPRARPTLYGEKMKQTAVWLRSDQLDYLKTKGNASQYIRELIDEDMRNA